jgi:hypothetical protein
MPVGVFSGASSDFSFRLFKMELSSSGLDSEELGGATGLTSGITGSTFGGLTG